MAMLRACQKIETLSDLYFNFGCRDLSRPIGALNPKRFNDFLERFREQKVQHMLRPFS